MAEPEHTPTLDGWDRLTVAVYRGSLAVGVLSEASGPASVAAVAYGASGLLIAGMTVGKLRMPVGHDIGRRDAYEV